MSAPHPGRYRRAGNLLLTAQAAIRSVGAADAVDPPSVSRAIAHPSGRPRDASRTGAR